MPKKGVSVQGNVQEGYWIHSGIVVEEIKNGTVVDHISAGDGLWLYIELIQKIQAQAQNPESLESVLLQNVKSKKHGRKDIIKITEFYVPAEWINPEKYSGVTLNYIKNGEVTSKIKIGQYKKT